MHAGRDGASARGGGELQQQPAADGPAIVQAAAEARRHLHRGWARYGGVSSIQQEKLAIRLAWPFRITPFNCAAFFLDCAKRTSCHGIHGNRPPLLLIFVFVLGNQPLNNIFSRPIKAVFLRTQRRLPSDKERSTGGVQQGHEGEGHPRGV